MGNNTFRSLAIAASMLGMSADKASGQGTAEQVETVKSRVTALAVSLPTGFTGARTVLKGDMAGLQDGMSSEEAEALKKHAEALLPTSPAEAQALIDALNPTGTITDLQQADAKPEVSPKTVATPPAQKDQKAGAIPPPPKPPIVPKSTPEKVKKDKDLLTAGPEIGPNNSIRIPWAINPGTTCLQHDFDQDGKMILGESGYLQLTQNIKPDNFPKKVIAFCEARVGLSAKFTFFLDEKIDGKDKLEIAIPNGAWSEPVEAPKHYKDCIISMFLDAKKNNGQSLPKFEVRKAPTK